MPELPEVEVVRRGLAGWLPGARLGPVEVHHPRAVRRHVAGAADLVARLDGAVVTDVVRRGKFLWLCLADGPVLLAHLGMSGQLLLPPAGAPPERHLRVSLGLSGGPTGAGRLLCFVDQRMFGGLWLEEPVPTPDGGPGGLAGPADAPHPSAAELPPSVRHVARDALDPDLDVDALVARIRRRTGAVKRALLDQTLVSGIGNIYADEALWRAGIHHGHPCDALPARRVRALLAAAREVMLAALAEGGTSFDSLYVDVNGASGYFERSLAVYGRTGRPCRRCGTPVVRERFTNRSSFGCPTCQPPAVTAGHPAAANG